MLHTIYNYLNQEKQPYKLNELTKTSTPPIIYKTKRILSIYRATTNKQHTQRTAKFLTAAYFSAPLFSYTSTYNILITHARASYVARRFTLLAERLRVSLLTPAACILPNTAERRTRAHRWRGRARVYIYKV